MRPVGGWHYPVSEMFKDDAFKREWNTIDRKVLVKTLDMGKWSANVALSG